jgi:predicted nucleic acid-binding Zn ribbon protein
MPQPALCPKCSSDFVKRVRRVGFEHLMSVFYIYLFRCQPCGHRFRVLQRGVTYRRIETDPGTGSKQRRKAAMKERALRVL